jgi:galactose-1-phosphate uridylyltransferase
MHYTMCDTMALWEVQTDAGHHDKHEVYVSVASAKALGCCCTHRHLQVVATTNWPGCFAQFSCVPPSALHVFCLQKMQMAVDVAKQ